MASAPLRHIPVTDLRTDDLPQKKIRTDDDVEHWKQSRGYQDYGLFLRRLTDSVVGTVLPWTEPISKPSQTVITLLDDLDHWIDEIPPLPTPQRFGNLAFRTWGHRLEAEADEILTAYLPPALHPAVPFLAPYLATSFGSPVRMDYGTGHETSFSLFLLCLTLLRFLKPEPQSEREMVLCVFVRYLKLCWRLQDVYKLEPAGSHGVWGLDDSHFLGYVFGSGQLRDQSEIPVTAILRPPLPPSNLYFMSIMRIHEVKHGPFHEHSSQLYAIATGVASWSKVNSGLFKMYEAEVLGKRVVVQHLPLGGLLEWAARPTCAGAASNWNAPAPSPARAGDQTRGHAHLNHPRHGIDARGHFLAPPRRGAAPDGPVLPARMPLGPSASTRLLASGHRTAAPVPADAYGSSRSSRDEAEERVRAHARGGADAAG